VGTPCFEVVGTWHYLLVEGTGCTVEVEGTVEVELHNRNIDMYYICIPFDNLDNIIAWSDLLLQANRILKKISHLLPFTEMSCRENLRKPHYESHVSDTMCPPM